MDSYIIPIAVLAATWVIANRHAKMATTQPLVTSSSGVVPLEQLPRDPIAPDTSQSEVAPRTENPVSGALGFGVPSLAPHLVLPWQQF